ncbi:substrate-binding domain-containing protein [Rubellimicrobium aerolatum]|uniref:Substrate-binding domain-containing protein n=1 Tax=Rubellimicrobium aerolatum TaxID=490979 RepID=A0ABW0SH92_9RHOB|nr:substrate-binding domain-containing protein [Rubellimicrobium aerolatum]MBP1807635.1 inositol transport system substrate-binding protein [Rubellimicrobium aerolatum]
MKTRLLLAALGLGLAGAASAQSVGVSIVNFDNNFQTLLRNGMAVHAEELGVDIQIEDAQNDMAKQLDQVNNFIANGVDAIVVTLVDSSAGPALTQAAEAAGVPLVYVNLEPANLADLPANQAYVGSNEVESGTLGATEACRLLREAGAAEATGVILIGDLAHQAAVQRTKDVHDVLATPDCSFITITDEQVGGWSREGGSNLMTNWLSSGDTPDVVFANNDEMALGAIQALSAAGVPKEDVIVVGIDATADGLQAMQAEDLDVTVFQNAKAQGAGGLDTALALAKGETVTSPVYVPFELVTPTNMADYIGTN